jgi:hypothetical protein
MGGDIGVSTFLKYLKSSIIHLHHLLLVDSFPTMVISLKTEIHIEGYGLQKSLVLELYPTKTWCPHDTSSHFPSDMTTKLHLCGTCQSFHEEILIHAGLSLLSIRLSTSTLITHLQWIWYQTIFPFNAIH